jgi:hypothetical protein
MCKYEFVKYACKHEEGPFRYPTLNRHGKVKCSGDCTMTSSNKRTVKGDGYCAACLRSLGGNNRRH